MKSNSSARNTNISVILVTWNGGQYIPKCLESLRRQSLPPDNLIIIDNGSSDGTPEIARRIYPDAVIIQNHMNLGVAKGWNMGLAACHPSTEIVVFINQDIELTSSCLEYLIKAFQISNDVGIVGSKLLYPDSNIIQHAGGVIDFPICLAYHRGEQELDTGQFDKTMKVDYVTGACLAIKLEL